MATTTTHSRPALDTREALALARDTYPDAVRATAWLAARPATALTGSVITLDARPARVLRCTIDDISAEGDPDCRGEAGYRARMIVSHSAV